MRVFFLSHYYCRCLLDSDDEVRDRAVLYLEVLKQKQKALSSAYILNRKPASSFCLIKLILTSLMTWLPLICVSAFIIKLYLTICLRVSVVSPTHLYVPMRAHSWFMCYAHHTIQSFTLLRYTNPSDSPQCGVPTVTVGR